MTKVLKSDASSADAWVEKDLGSDQTDVWETASILIPSATLAAWGAAGSPGGFLNLLDGSETLADTLGVASDISGDGPWTSPNGTGATPVVADAWQLCEFHHVVGGAVALYVNGVLQFTGTDGSGVTALRRFRVGQFLFSAAVPGSIIYVRDPKIGTTRGGAQLFADDFSSGNLSAWTSTSGAVSVVDDPSVLVWTNLGPQLIATVAGGVNSGSFSDPQVFPLTAASRSPFDILKDNVQAVSVRFTQEGASAETEIYAVDTDVRTYEPGITGGQ